MSDVGDVSLPESFRTEDVIVYKARPNLFLLQTRESVSSSIYLILGRCRCLLIDAGGIVRDLTSVVRRITGLPFDVALTHGHRDHVGAIGEFERLHLHPGDRALIPDYAGAITDLHPGDRFDLGDRHIDVVDLIGHSPGSVGFLDSDNRWLFTGDALGTNPCFMQLTALPLDVILGVLDRVEALHPSWTELWCGHFNHLKRPQGIRYLLRLRRLVAKVLDPAGNYPPGATAGKGPHAMGLEGQILVFNPANLRTAGQ